MDSDVLVMPNLLQTKREYDRMIRDGVDEDKIFILSKQPYSKQVFKGHILSCFKYTNLFPTLLTGLFLGSGIGIIVYLLAASYGIEINFHHVETLYPIVLTVLISIWVASLVGITDVKREFRNYISYVNKGWTLLVVEPK